MQHLSIFPILIPLLFGTIMLLPPISRDIHAQRVTSIIGTLFLLVSCAFLLYQINNQGVQLYALGGWQAPFGIALVADKVSGLLVLLTAFLAFAVMLYAVAGQDKGALIFTLVYVPNHGH